jgi:hypothetical protein
VPGCWPLFNCIGVALFNCNNSIEQGHPVILDNLL